MRFLCLAVIISGRRASRKLFYAMGILTLGALLSCDGASGVSGSDGPAVEQESMSAATIAADPEIASHSAQPGYDLFLVIGQSNTHYGLGLDPVLDTAPPGIFQLGRGGARELKVLPADEPLDHFSKQKNRIGFALPFAKIYQRYLLSKKREILLIPGGRGSTGLLSGSWKRGGELYQDAVVRVNYLLETYPQSKLKAILWHQGESDYFNLNYSRDLEQMISDLRSDIHGASEVPFILGGLVPEWLREGSADVVERKKALQTSIRAVSEHLKYTGFADSNHPEIRKYNVTSEPIHFDAPGQRLLGQRYFDAYRSALGNTLVSKPPDQIQRFRLIGKDRSVTVAWFPPRANHSPISGFRIFYRKEGSDDQRSIEVGGSEVSPIKYTIGNLTNGQPYEVSIAAFNAEGEGPRTASESAMPSAGYRFCRYHLALMNPDFSSECGKPAAVGGTLFSPWNGEFGFKWYVAENQSDIGGILTGAFIDGDYTKALWFYVEPQGKLPKNQYLMSSASTDSHAFLVYPDGSLAAGHNGHWNDVRIPAGSIVPMTWYHAALSYRKADGALMLYLNGELVAKGKTSEIAKSDLMIGKHLSHSMKGRLFDVRLYSGVALNDEEIAAIYGETKPRGRE